MQILLRSTYLSLLSCTASKVLYRYRCKMNLKALCQERYRGDHFSDMRNVDQDALKITMSSPFVRCR